MALKDTIRNWETLGKKVPLRAILNDKDKNNTTWDFAEFMETGRSEIKKLLEYISTQKKNISYGRALDFGCGAGRLTQAIAPHFKETHGVDAASSMITLANQHNAYRPSCTYHVNKENNLSLFKDNYFDFIYSNITLQHMEPTYAENYIREFIRTLKKDGVLVFQIPSELKSIATKQTTSTHKEFVKKVIPTTLMNLYYRVKHMKNGFIDMFGIKKNTVIQILNESGGRLIHVSENNNAGANWTSYSYLVTK